MEHEAVGVLAHQRVDASARRASVPSVATTSAWVSPRVNSAEPWVRGSTPVRISIGRTVRVSRPSMRGSPSQDLAAHDLGFDVEQDVADLRPRRRSPPSAVSAGDHSRPSTSRMAWRAGLLVCGSGRRRAAWLRPAPRPWRSSASSFGGGAPVPLRLAGVAHQFVDRVDGDVASARGRTPRAPSMISSDSCWASDSTISTAASVPATTRSICDVLRAGSWSGSARTGR